MKTAMTAAGTRIESCPGCGSNPIRNHPHDEKLDVERNWTRTCPSCARKLCLVCYPPTDRGCRLDDCEAIAFARALEAPTESP